MCFDSCGNTIQNTINQYVASCIASGKLPADAKVIMDAEPVGLGIHSVFLVIKTTPNNPNPYISQEMLLFEIKGAIEQWYEVLEKDSSEEKKQNNVINWINNAINWINIAINLIAMGLVIGFSLFFPPSLMSSIGLTAISFVSTAFTCRKYLFALLRNMRTLKLTSFVNMSTTVSLGWLSSMAHAIFHVIKMPMMDSFSMVFMNFMMPNLLITCINAMDELKRIIVEKSVRIQLNSLNALMPEMEEEYSCFALSAEEQNFFSITEDSPSSNVVGKSIEKVLTESNFDIIQKVVSSHALNNEKRKLLEAGMIIQVNKGKCFPVDGFLVEGSTVVDASIINGEPQRNKKRGQWVPAGAINLGEPVLIWAEKNPYNSQVNKLLFRSNRENQEITTPNVTTPLVTPPKPPRSLFVYFYSALIIIGLVAVIVTPLILGVISVQAILPPIIGILFSVCPCTFAIAYQLPELLSLHFRSSKGVHLRRKELLDTNSSSPHTIIFDKTGTLTTGNANVSSSDISATDYLWERIYLIETAYGRGHPIARAILMHFDSAINLKSPFHDVIHVKHCEIDPKNRGLSALVQENTIHIGNANYLEDNGIAVQSLDESKLEQGYSVVCVAEKGVHRGTIYIQHEIREGVVEALIQYKKEKKKIIMLTGDNELSAKGLNAQLLAKAQVKGLDKTITKDKATGKERTEVITAIFEEDDIRAGKIPEDKEAFIKTIQTTVGVDPKGVWYIGDGLNDGPCCREVSEKGGLSFSVNANDKSAFFTDISLNGSFDYLDKHRLLNLFSQKMLLQNKGILTYSTVAFLAFTLSFLVVGVPLSPLIPMALMVSTTFYILFNSYRIQFSVDNAFEKKPAILSRLLSSDLSSGLLLVGATFLIVSIMTATIASGGLALPIVAFSTTLAAFCSGCTLASISCFGIFTLVLGCHLGFSRSRDARGLNELKPPIQINTAPVIPPKNNNTSPTTDLNVKEKLYKSFCWNSATPSSIKPTTPPVSVDPVSNVVAP